MKWFHDLRIASKLIVSFVAVLLLMAVLGIFSVRKLADVNHTATELARNWMPSIDTAGDIRYSLSRVRTLALQHILSEDKESMDRYEQRMAGMLDQLKKARQKYEGLMSGAEERRHYAELSSLIEAYMAEQGKVIGLSHEGRKDEANAAMRGAPLRLFAEIETRVEQIIKINEEGAAKANELGDQLYETSRTLIIGLLAAAVALGLSLAVWGGRTIARALSEAVAVAQTVAAGDLTSRIEVRSKDEIGQLMQALKAMNENLVKIVAEVRTGTDTIATASGQIAAGNLDLSSRTEEQASSLEETASSMEELTSTVKQNAENARQANGLVQSAASVAVKGGNVVSQVVDTMGSINESSKKIVDIIAVIDGIAFQTNILALNAAVEAARAGEQGRGFAVVASEVRTLAQRSAAAAKEIKSLIDDSVGKVNTGAKLVDEAGATMQEIVESVKRVTDIMGEITAASHEQTAGIEQINQAVVQMDQATQQNASLVEEAAAASESMQEQAAKLAQAVAVFKLDGMQVSKAAPAAQPRAIKSAAPKVLNQLRGPQLAAAGAEWEQF